MKENQETLIFHVPNELFQPSASKALDGFFDVSELHGQFDNFKLEKPIEYHLTVTNTGDALLIEGSAKTLAITACSRCLEDIEVELSCKVDAYYLINKPETYDEEQINEFEILPSDRNIPIGDIIKRTLVVDAPAKPICSEDCVGLCKKCGANLNKTNCECTDDVDDSNPFSVLKNFSVKE